MLHRTFALGLLVLVACGSRTELSIGEALPVAECTWTFAGAPVRVSESADPRDYIESVADAIPTDGGALVAWTTERDGPRRVTVRRLAWDLVANGEPRVVLEVPYLWDQSVTLASGFGRTAVAASTGRVIIQPLTGDGALNGSQAKLEATAAFDLRATPTGFDLLVDSTAGTQLGRLELARVDSAGSEVARAGLLEAPAGQSFAAGPGRAPLPDGSFIVTTRTESGKGTVFARHFAQNGDPSGALQTLATLDADSSIRLPVVQVPGGALAGWLTGRDSGSKYMVRPLSPNAFPRGEAIAIAPLEADAFVVAFDLKADGERGALAVWLVRRPGTITLQLRALGTNGTPIGPQMELQPVPDLTFGAQRVRLVVQENHGLVLIGDVSGPSGGPEHVYALPLSCVR